MTDELAAAEKWARDFAVVSTVHGPRMVGYLLAEYDLMRADLARALPIVWAAEALVEHRSDAVAYLVGTGFEAKESLLFVALARAVNAGKEPPDPNACQHGQPAATCRLCAEIRERRGGDSGN